MKKQTDKELEAEILDFCKNENAAYARQSAARAARRKEAEESGLEASIRMKMRLAKTLYDMRKSAELTQKELAKRMKTDQSAIAKMECGQGNVTVEKLERYARACGKTIDFSFS